MMGKCEECGKDKPRPKKPDKKRLQELGLRNVKKMINKLEEEKVALYESMGKILSGDFEQEVSTYQEDQWYCAVRIKETNFNEFFFIDKDTGKDRHE